jgi:hypothetical protein
MPEFFRLLQISTPAATIDVQVKIASPDPQGDSWSCRFEIGWPEGIKAGEAWGADAIQAFYLAMQAVALQLYGSDYHKQGRLYWQKPGTGYGFPLPKNLASEYIGHDKDVF